MEMFFKWLSDLSNAEIVSYSVLICILMIFIPFAETFFKIGRKLVFMKRMSIKHFSYQFYPIEFVINEDDKSILQVIETPDFVIEGGKVLLHWEIDGALSVSLYPKYGKVKGNAAEVVVSRNYREFHLIAKGLLSRKKITISIPHEKIKKLETDAICNFKLFSEIALVDSHPFSEGVPHNHRFTENLLKIKGFNQLVFTNHPFTTMPHNFTHNLLYRNADVLSNKKKQLKERVELNKTMKIYTFSTKKYNQVNQFNNP
jgi:hypothetical protein